MDFINLKSLNLTAEESEDVIKLLAQKRGITTKKLLSTIKLNLKRKDKKDLPSKSRQKLIKSIKSQQKLIKTQLELVKTQQKLIKSIKKQQKITKQTKSQRELIKSQRKLKKQQQTSSNTRKIRKPLYNIDKKINNTNVDKKINNTNDAFIENIRDLFSTNVNNKINNTNVDKKINNTNDEDFIENIKDLFNNKLDKKTNNNNTNDDYIENIRDLFSILDYEPVLIKSGFDNNYLEYLSNGNDSLSLNEYLELIKPYLNDLINVYKAKGEWKLQISAEISFVSQKPESDETRTMFTRSTPEEFMIGSETEEVAENLTMSILQKYQDNLQNKMKGSDFIFNGINYLYYDLNRVTISKGGSYIESPKWLKDKKFCINQKNIDNKCFQYAATLALNLNNIDKDRQRISKIKPFVNNYNWKDINFPAAKKDWNKFEINNKNIALNILYVPFNTKKVEITYKSKYNLIRDNQIILLKINNGENWHYLTVKNLSGLLRGISINHNSDYYCLNCFQSYRTENKLNVHKKYVKITIIVILKCQVLIKI